MAITFAPTHSGTGLGAWTRPTHPARQARPTRTVRSLLGGRRFTLPVALVGMGLALIPWMFLLAAQGEWPWVGLDVAEAAGLISTGLLLRRGDARGALTAAVTAALLLTDASFDVTTSHGAELVQAWVLALLLELPIAALCGRLALRWGRVGRVRSAG
ncbi:hypothetical protein DN069_25150 [Streptacidiphilus pinicola]|uniref:Uncharacterized protein n=1 Tax=Streptacidiphilus pinicola TaxID=2219663 RepID=A0A2X0K5K5_9ACTN|nr:hypothetical protein [Streptacidiphilus pinicola]RAG82859.1 hypothetical protein DN069_25150 [Streptacidiphilus pinicola]